jgi:hypothetical protein
MKKVTVSALKNLSKKSLRTFTGDSRIIGS